MRNNRNNKAILDEAARSVRRTFVGSVAGSVTMLAVVGAAGAYGMPEKLTSHALSAAMAKLNAKFVKTDHALAPVEPHVRVAENVKPHATSPVTDVSMDDARQDVFPQMTASIPIEPVASPVTPLQTREARVASPVVSPQAREALAAVAPTAKAPALVRTLPVVEPAPALVAEPLNVKPVLTKSDPKPVVTASLVPDGLPEMVEPRSFIPAPLVFELPKASDAQPLREMPNTEVVITAPDGAKTEKAPEPAEAAKPVEAAPIVQASLEPQPEALELPKLVSLLRLPMPKPPLSPAQRLDLSGKDYDKAEKCLAQAIYFEARNEPPRGQQAVAQVVLNRVFSPYYPKDVCSVVYQNAHRHLSCQFTFACDGKPESISERGAWARANRVATQTLNAQVWLPEVNKATHYHAAYVRPNWIRDMKVMVRYGLHTFYRPRNWGDGSDEAHWGSAANSAKPTAAQPAKPLTPAQKRFAYRRT